MRRVWFVLALGSVSCAFDASIAVDGVNNLDGAPGTDGDPDDPLCGYTYSPAHFNACDDPQPTVTVSMNGSVTYNSDSNAFSSPSVGTPATSMIAGVRVVWTEDLTIKGTLRVEGSFPVMFVASGEINIDGTLDASSAYDGTTYGLGAGASNVASACATPPDVGVQCANHGASGGGGGGFGGVGGGGDHGAAARNCGDSSGRPPTMGGSAVAVPTTIRAGCAGASGSSTDNGSAGDEGLGGPGGGAVHLTARQGLSISGIVHVGGGAGGPGTAGRASGGGGGSGGYIGLEAETITLTSTAILAANGGGGGGGCEDATAQAGENAQAALVAAQGGPQNDNGDPGNDGAFLGAGPEDPGTAGDRGGGGGGGGLGYILFHVGNSAVVDGGAVVTPAVTNL